MVASNMDTVGTFGMAEVLAKHSLFTTIHKHYTVAEWTDFVERINHDTQVILSLLLRVAGILFYFFQWNISVGNVGSNLTK